MEQRFRNNDNSEWGNHAAAAMCDETRDFPLQLDDGKKRTMGDLYDLTNKEYISKVMLEDKVFTTWHHGRYVLIGDGMCWRAFRMTLTNFCLELHVLTIKTHNYFLLRVACHKLNPSGGHGKGVVLPASHHQQLSCYYLLIHPFPSPFIMQAR